MLPPREVEARYLCCLHMRLKHIIMLPPREVEHDNYVVSTWGWSTLLCCLHVRLKHVIYVASTWGWRTLLMLPPREVEARYLCCLHVRLKHVIYVASTWGWSTLFMLPPHEVETFTVFFRFELGSYSWAQRSVTSTHSRVSSSLSWARICKRLRIPGIDSKEWILPGWESIPELL